MELRACEFITVNRSNGYYAAAIYESFCRMLADDVGQRDDHLASESGYDHTLAGMFFLSIEAGMVVNKVIDWDKWDIGVFAYEHLDYFSRAGINGSDCLSAYLFREISRDDWYQIIGNYKVPTVPELEKLIRAWSTEQDLPLVEAE